MPPGKAEKIRSISFVRYATVLLDYGKPDDSVTLVSFKDF